MSIPIYALRNGRFCVSCPSESDVVAEVGRRLSVVKELEAAVSTNLQRATRLRQPILQNAFSSRLVALCG